MEEKKKKLQFPHVIILLIALVAVFSILTYIVPAGAYEREINDTGREVVVAGSFEFVEATPVSLLTFLSSFHNGFLKGADIIMLVLACGGAFAVLNETKAIEAGIGRLTRALRGKERLVIPIIMFLFALGGGALSIYEETLPFIPIMIGLALSLGFDSLVGMAIVAAGLSTGFAGAFLSPVVVGTAQSIAGLPILSGFQFRLVMFAVLCVTSISYIFLYAGRIKKKPELSVMYELDQRREDLADYNDLVELSPRRIFVLLALVASLIILGVGVIKLGWWYAEITAVFLGMGFAVGIISGMHYNEFSQVFLKGISEIAGGAMVICFANAIIIVMQSGQILDTILYGASSLLSTFPPLLSALGMYVFQCLLNFAVPSGTGQAALSMPIMAPLAELVGVTKQTAVIAFQLGDGISNILTPTCGYLMIALAMARIPWEKWVKFIWKFIVMQYVIGAIFVAAAHLMQLGPF